MSLTRGPVFICAGEPSGDLYAASFVDMLVRANSHLDLYGVGGQEMKRAGVSVLLDYQEMMTYGLSSAFAFWSTNLTAYHVIAHLLQQYRPEIFIAVAYPGLNLLLCRYARKLGARVWYFMPPQIWAWGEFRKYLIKRWVDKIYSVFPFEVDFYKDNKIEAELIKNPLVGKLQQYKRRDFARRIGYMPGSRSTHIRRNMPVMIRIMNELQDAYSQYKTTLILHSKPAVTQIEPYMRSLSQPVQILAGDRYQAMKDCDVLVISSGTASLEAAYMDIPQIFIHRPSWIDYHISRRFIKIREYNLVNLVCADDRVPSCITPHAPCLVSFVKERIAIVLTGS